MKVYVSRESVCAADDCDAPDTRRFAIGGDWNLDDLLTRAITESDLAQIDGGRATWVLSSKIPLAVHAQQWSRPMRISQFEPRRSELDVVNDELRLHWSYLAQRDPHVVLDVLKEIRFSAVAE